jgi:hypothetical protein
MPGGRGRLGTITQRCVPVETVSKWPMQKSKAAKLWSWGHWLVITENEHQDNLAVPQYLHFYKADPLMPEPSEHY